MSKNASDWCWRTVTGNARTAATGQLLQLKWSTMEPSSGVYDFTELDANITAASQKGMAVEVMLEVCKGGDGTTPAWLYDAGVIAVHYKNNGSFCPYYLQPLFQTYLTRAIKAYTDHMRTLPNVFAVQVALGITGDDRPWDGVPFNSSYEITPGQWANYTAHFADVYCSALTASGIGITINLENPGLGQNLSWWFTETCNGTGGVRILKEGIVSHGYQLNGEVSLYNATFPELWETQAWGDFGRSRGELAVDPLTPGHYGNWNVSWAWSLHANALWGLTFGLDIWNLYSTFLLDPVYTPTLELFNRHAGVKDPRNATAAVVYLRDGLDSSNFTRFPADRFGGDVSPGSCADPPCGRNASRMVAIAAAFGDHGARQDEPLAAIGKSVKQKKAMALNDAGWQIWPGNYGNFIRQVAPGGVVARGPDGLPLGPLRPRL